MLLENGYGIAEWPEAIGSISSWSELEHHNTGQMRLLGVSEEDIPREVTRFRNENIGEWKKYRAILKSRTGISDDGLLNDLMHVELHWPFYNDPLNTEDLVFNQGESFLSDADWMEPRHDDALDRYEGDVINELTAREIAGKWGNEMFKVNEHEAILDRENIHPALREFRGENYYESKRRLSELGARRVEQMRDVVTGQNPAGSQE